MAKVIDISTYRQKESACRKVKEIINLFPLVEDAVDAEIARVSPSKEVFDMVRDSPQVNLSVASSLCFTLANYLSRLVVKPNEFDMTEDTVESFIVEMIIPMMRDILLTKEKMNL